MLVHFHLKHHKRANRTIYQLPCLKTSTYEKASRDDFSMLNQHNRIIRLQASQFLSTLCTENSLMSVPFRRSISRVQKFKSLKSSFSQELNIILFFIIFFFLSVRTCISSSSMSPDVPLGQPIKPISSRPIQTWNSLPPDAGLLRQQENGPCTAVPFSGSKFADPPDSGRSKGLEHWAYFLPQKQWDLTSERSPGVATRL
jgi:hypothetical protein